MGGSGGGGSSGRPSGIGGGGGGGGRPLDPCPLRLRTTVLGPAAGLVAGTWLELMLDRSAGQPKIVLVELVSNAAVGALGAVPDLDILINCIDTGVEYRAYVDSVSGGRVEITVVRQ